MVSLLNCLALCGFITELYSPVWFHYWIVYPYVVSLLNCLALCGFVIELSSPMWFHYWIVQPYVVSLLNCLAPCGFITELSSPDITLCGWLGSVKAQTKWVTNYWIVRHKTTDKTVATISWKTKLNYKLPIEAGNEPTWSHAAGLPTSLMPYPAKIHWKVQITSVIISFEKLRKRGWTLTTSQYTVTHIVLKEQSLKIQKLHIKQTSNLP